jgi:hypothetical protein
MSTTENKALIAGAYIRCVDFDDLKGIKFRLEEAGHEVGPIEAIGGFSRAHYLLFNGKAFAQVEGVRSEWQMIDRTELLIACQETIAAKKQRAIDERTLLIEVKINNKPVSYMMYRPEYADLEIAAEIRQYIKKENL